MVNVMEAFHEFPLETCKKVWTTAQMVMNEILRCNGGNTYKLPHARKDKVIRKMEQAIPLRLPCQSKLTGGGINGEVVMAYMTGGLTASSRVAATPQVRPTLELLLLLLHLLTARL